MGLSDTTNSGDQGEGVGMSARGGARVPEDLGGAGALEDQGGSEGRAEPAGAEGVERRRTRMARKSVAQAGRRLAEVELDGGGSLVEPQS